MTTDTAAKVCERCDGTGKGKQLKGYEGFVDWIQCGQCAGTGKWAPDAAAIFAAWEQTPMHTPEEQATWDALVDYHRQQGWVS